MPSNSQPPTAPPRSPLAAIIAGRAQRQPPPGSQSQTLPLTKVNQPAQSNQSIQSSQPGQPAQSSQEITSSGGETAQEIDQCLRKSVRAWRNALVETAYYIRLLSDQGEWTSLGFAGSDEYRESLGLSESQWETHLLLGERLSSLTLDQMREITISTARMITSINAKIWDEFAWVEEARVLRPKEFAALVAKRNQDLKVIGRGGVGGVGGIGGIGVEPRSNLTLAVPASQQERLEGRIESLRRTRKLKSLSDAIELALSAAEREPIFSSQIQKLVQAVEELDRVWDHLPVESEEERGRRLAEGEDRSVAEAALVTQKITRRMLLVLSDLVQRNEEGGSELGPLSHEIERNSPKAAHD